MSSPMTTEELIKALRKISDAADELNAELDKQTYDDVHAGEFDLPDDYEHHVVLTNKRVRDFSEAICAAQEMLRRLDATGEVAPAGWKLVPEEPAPEQLRSLAEGWCRDNGIDPDEPQPPHGEYPRWYEACDQFANMYRTMLSAAPPPPALESAWLGAGNTLSDLTDEIAAAVVALPWARGSTVDEHCDRHGDIQNVVEKILLTPPATSEPSTEE